MDGIHSIKMLWVLYSPMAPTRIFEVEREREIHSWRVPHSTIQRAHVSGVML